MSAVAVPLEQAMSAQSWAERNQGWLSRRFALWRSRLEDEGRPEPDDLQLGIGRDTGDDDDAAALRLAAIFGLSAFERELLILVAGMEIDNELRDAVVRVQGSPRGQAVRLTFETALGLLPGPHWDALSPSAALRHWSLVEFDPTGGFLKAAMRVDERVLHYLTGVEAIDERLKGIAGLEDDPVPDEAGAMSARIALAVEGVRGPLVTLANASQGASYRRAGRRLATAVFLRLGLRTLWIDPGALPGEPGELTEVARRIDREAALSVAGVAVPLDPDGSHGADAVRLLAHLRSPVIVLGQLSQTQLADLPGRRSLRFNVEPTRPALQAGLAPEVERAARRALHQFRVDPSLLDQALAGLGRLDAEAAIELDLWDFLRESARGGLDALAQRVESRTTLDDLVVPPFVGMQLREIAGQLRHRQRVYDDWGFGERNSRGLGIAALFAGESGTGKTFAAEAIANEARLDLYRIDLAGVVSKYIGETEKNLSRLFEAAETSGAVLLFDEADAIFGKRSEVKDSHDRYANIEVAYLLQRIESYRGLAILTTNMKSGLDRAFLRRIRHVVQFPFPNERSREQIWRRQFPPGAPVAELDWGGLARLQLSGGNIRSVALSAAFKAAEVDRSIDQLLVLEAARAEFARLERTMPGQVREAGN
jgi:hypothetical protein